MSNWQEVKQLNNLAQLNLKIASDSLDDCIDDLVEAQTRLYIASKEWRKIKEKLETHPHP